MTRLLSRDGCVAIQSRSAPMSFTESSRFSALSSARNVLPKPDEPRTFGKISDGPSSFM